MLQVLMITTMLMVAPVLGSWGATVSPVYLDDEVILRIRFEAGGFSPAQRAEIIQNRVNSLIRLPSPPGIAKAVTINGIPVVAVDSTPLVTVDIHHARANNTTPAALARVWAANIQRALQSRVGNIREERLISFMPVSDTAQGGIVRRQFRVFTTEGQWRRFWMTEERPRVDFSHNIVIGTFMGQQRTAGYSMKILRIKQRQDRVTVTVQVTQPGPGDIVAQVITTPQHLVESPRSDFLPRQNLTFTFVDQEGVLLGEVKNVDL